MYISHATYTKNVNICIYQLKNIHKTPIYVYFKTHPHHRSPTNAPEPLDPIPPQRRAAADRAGAAGTGRSQRVAGGAQGARRQPAQPGDLPGNAVSAGGAGELGD